MLLSQSFYRFSVLMKRKQTLSETAANMEVHHHAHSDRKRFRHYLFEFFMLFLAVFSGFLAEYFLEHTIEHQREKQFIESMVSDLRDDTTKIRRVYEFNKMQLKGLDTLIRLLYTHPSHPDSLAKVYRLYTRYALNYEMVVFTDRTMTQLKNSGGMRLIRKQSVSDSIMNYDAGIKACELQFQVVRDGWKDASSYSYQLFDLGKIFRRPEPSMQSGPYRFITNDEQTLTAYGNRLLMYAGVVRGYTMNIAEQKNTAERLVHYLEKQYHL